MPHPAIIYHEYVYQTSSLFQCLPVLLSSSWNSNLTPSHAESYVSPAWWAWGHLGVKRCVGICFPLVCSSSGPSAGKCYLFEEGLWGQAAWVLLASCAIGGKFLNLSKPHFIYKMGQVSSSHRTALRFKCKHVYRVRSSAPAPARGQSVSAQ